VRVDEVIIIEDDDIEHLLKRSASNSAEKSGEKPVIMKF